MIGLLSAVAAIFAPILVCAFGYVYCGHNDRARYARCLANIDRLERELGIAPSRSDAELLGRSLRTHERGYLGDLKTLYDAHKQGAEAVAYEDAYRQRLAELPPASMRDLWLLSCGHRVPPTFAPSVDAIYCAECDAEVEVVGVVREPLDLPPPSRVPPRPARPALPSYTTRP